MLPKPGKWMRLRSTGGKGAGGCTETFDSAVSLVCGSIRPQFSHVAAPRRRKSSASPDGVMSISRAPVDRCSKGVETTRAPRPCGAPGHPAHHPHNPVSCRNCVTIDGHLIAYALDRMTAASIQGSRAEYANSTGPIPNAPSAPRWGFNLVLGTRLKEGEKTDLPAVLRAL